jgi:hypothetical protein
VSREATGPLAVLARQIALANYWFGRQARAFALGEAGPPA